MESIIPVIFLVIIIILVNVLILRWVFRVNEIVSLLKKILAELKVGKPDS